MLSLASSEKLYLLREELCTPGLYLPKSSVEVPCVGSPVRTSQWKSFCVKAGTQSYVLEPRNKSRCLRLIYFLLLSLSLCLASFILSYHSYMLDCVCLCASLVFNQESFIQHLNSYLKEFRGDSSEPFTGNSATLFGYTKCVAISF